MICNSDGQVNGCRLIVGAESDEQRKRTTAGEQCCIIDSRSKIESDRF